MKKIVDFKSQNIENSLMDKLLALIENKIHNSIVALLLTIVVGLSMIGLYIGFFVMPFITYSSMVLKIIFSILWGFSCIVFVAMAIDQSKQEKNDDMWGFIIINVGLMVFLGLCLINNNYYYLGDWWQIAIFVVMGLYTVLMLHRFIKELIKDPRGTLSTLFMGIMFVLGFLFILASSLSSLEMELRKKELIIGTVLIAIPIISMLIAKILKISKAEKVLEYGSLIIVCVLLLIGLSYVISFLNPKIDGYKTFVALFASFLGGGITLVGVAWTIKDGNKKRQSELERVENERKEEERKKYRPFVNVYAGYNVQGLNTTSDILVTKWLNNTESISNEQTERLVVANNIRNCWLGNTDFCSFYVFGIKINGNMASFDSIRFIKKEYYFPLNFTGPIYTEKPIEEISLILEDMLGNLYELKLDFSVNSAYQQIVINGNEPAVFIGGKEMLNKKDCENS